MFLRSARKASPPTEQPYAFTIAGKVTFPTAENAHVLHPRLTPRACKHEGVPPAQRGHVCAGLFIPQSTMPPSPPSCKRALAPSAAIRKEGAIEEEEGGKVEVKGEEKGPLSRSFFIRPPRCSYASARRRARKERKKEKEVEESGPPPPPPPPLTYRKHDRSAPVARPERE